MTEPEKLKHEAVTQPRWKQELKLLAIAGLALLLCNPISLCAFSQIVYAIQDEVVSYRYAQALFNYPLPPQTDHITREYGIRQTGTKTCWFSARMVIATSLTRADILAYYSGLTFPLPHLETKWHAEVRTGQLDDDEVTALANATGKNLTGLSLFSISLWHPEQYHYDGIDSTGAGCNRNT